MDTNQSWEALQTKSLQTLTWFLDKVQQGGDLAFSGMGTLGNELVQLVREVAIYHAIYNWTMFTVYMSMVVIMLTICKKHLKTVLAYDNVHKTSYGFCLMIIAVIVSLYGASCAKDSLSIATKATFAPRYFVVEEVTRLVKTTQNK